MASPPSKAPVAELTLRVFFLGLILSVVMSAANVYLGLKAGMTVSASIPAAVVAMLILRGIFRTGTILEANQVQTAASAGESLAAGIIFTMPALLFVGAWKQFDFWATTLISFTGGLLGILFMIPMRRVFVTGKTEELPFPEGVACAAVLQAGDADAKGHTDAWAVVQGAALGLTFKFLASFVGLFKNTLEGAFVWGKRIFYFGGDVAPLLVGVGLIVRLQIAVLIFLGGSIAWLIALPLLGSDAATSAKPLEGAWTLWREQVRYIGVGAMVMGGIASIIRVRRGLWQAVVELRKRADSTTQEEIPITDRDLPSKIILGLVLLCTLLVGGIYYSLTGHAGVTAVATLLMLIMSFFFTAVASYIVGLVGNSNSPVSGMTITAVLLSGGLILLFGFKGLPAMISTLGIAAIVCCVACTSGDVCNDLKTGQIVGASPYRQQIMQISGVAVASVVMAPIMQLLHANTPGGIGGKELSAPQAGLFASLAKGIFGDGKLPWKMVAIGLVLGLFILLGDKILERRKARFRLHLMPMAVGMYLPFGLAPPILLGGLIASFLAAGTSGEVEEKRLQRGVLFASGVIAGESLMGVGLALIASFQIKALSLGLSSFTRDLLSFGVSALVLVLFVVLSRPKQTSV